MRRRGGRSQLLLAYERNDYYITAYHLSCKSFRLLLPLRRREEQGVMFRLRRRDWIILAALIVAGAAGYGVYRKWADEGLRRTEADMKSNLPLRVDQNTTLVDVKYDRTHKVYWYVIDRADQFDPQEKARQVQDGVCANAENSLTMKKEGFSYEYHYRTKDGLALTDFKITSCE